MTHINPPTNHVAQIDRLIATEAAKELGISLKSLMDVDREAALAGMPAKMHGELYAEAMFALWRLLSNGRRDLFDLAVNEALRWHEGDIEEAKRDDRRMAS